MPQQVATNHELLLRELRGLERRVHRSGKDSVDHPRALGAFSGSKSLQRAQQSVGEVVSKWDTRVREAVKPAAPEAEAALHAGIRKHVAALKGGQRLAFLEKHASDPRVAASMLEAPKFLTNLTDGEELMIRNLIEASVLPPEIAQAKIAVTKALGKGPGVDC